MNGTGRGLRLQQAFERARNEGRRALIPYLTAGDPDLAATRRLALALVNAGADIVELGIPYSDPLADGPTIQAAGERALRSGTTIGGVMETARWLRRHADVPLVYLVYYNCIYRYGLDRFVEEAVQSGVDGLVVPDLPPEEAGALEATLSGTDLSLIYLLAPTSTSDRIHLVTERATGFIYCVSLTGVTGARDVLPDSLGAFVERVRALSKVPLAVGFGIATAQQAAMVAKVADGVIVGSAVVDRVAKASTVDEAVTTLDAYVGELRRAATVEGELDRSWQCI